MSLSSLRLRTAIVPYIGDGNEHHEIKLRGLSANAIAGIVVSQMSGIESVFNIVQGAGVKSPEDLAKVDMLEVGQRLLVQAPEFMARVIAYAAHEPEQWEVVRDLPAPTQIECLKHVAQLTFNDEAGFREFAGNVVAALRSAKRAVPQKLNPELPVSGSSIGGLESEPAFLS